MRIAILTNAIDEKDGGAGRIAALGVQGLKDRGHEVRTWGPKPWFVHRASLPVLYRLFEHIRDLAAWKETGKEIKDWKPDILLTHNLTGCGFGTPKGVQASGIPWIHIIHDVQLVEPSGQIAFQETKYFFKLAWRYFWSELRKFVFGTPNIVISPTRWLVDFYKNWGWFKKSSIRIIPNPAPECKPVETHQPGTILYVGRLESDKGFDDILKAWLNITSSDAKLICIGQGSLQKKAESMHDTRIKFLGQLSSDQVLEVMTQIAVVVVPSKIIENQPTVILEALASGCEVVASNLGGIPETLNGQGYLFSPGDIQELARILNEVLMKKKKTSDKKLSRVHEFSNYIDQLEAALREKR
ncbi:glycosyltransferase [Candidatus Uhrbacteria bacterium]|nr:glycosyltransferase [Candidatus Uhrbacteria bacterium]